MSVLTRIAHAKVRIRQAREQIDDLKDIIIFTAAAKIIFPAITGEQLTILGLLTVAALYTLGKVIEKTEFQKHVTDFTTQKFQARSWEINDLLKEIRDQNQVTLILKNPEGSARKYSTMKIGATAALFYLDPQVEKLAKAKGIGLHLATHDVLPYEEPKPEPGPEKKRPAQ